MYVSPGETITRSSITYVFSCNFENMNINYIKRKL